MPRVAVELTDKEIKEIIAKTKKNISEGIRELITQNKERLSITEDELRELISNAVFSHFNNLLSELKELLKTALKNKSAVDRKEFERTRGAILREIDSLKSKVMVMERDIQKMDTDLRVYAATNIQELRKELLGEMEITGYQVSQMTKIVGNLKAKIGSLEGRVELLERGEKPKECCLIHSS